MNAYRELFRLRLEHDYHAHGIFHAWHMAPSACTQMLMRGTGMVMRRAGNEAVFLLPASRFDLLRTPAGKPPAMPAPAVLLSIHANDPGFAGYTTPPVPAGSLLIADSRHAGNGAEGLLHPSTQLDALALLPAEAPLCQLALAGVLAPRRPVLIVRIELAADAAPRCFVARFGAAASYWKYYLAGPLAGRPLAIADLDAAVTFRGIGPVELERGHSAAVFQSERAIMLRERPGERFQLKEDGPFGERVLMKRMPVAGTGLRQREVIDGQVVQVSEIFINR